jgi:hypothetical protein
MGIKLLNKADGGKGLASGASTVRFDGVSISEFAKASGIKYDTIHQRLTGGWSVSDATSKPANKHNNRHYKYHEYLGVLDTIAGHCRRHGKSYAKVTKRITAYGFSFVDAMERV